MSATSQHPLLPPTTQKEPFAQIPFHILSNPNLTDGAVRLYGAIRKWDWGDGCFVGEDRLALELHKSVRTIRRNLRELEDQKAATVVHRGQGHTAIIYTCRPPVSGQERTDMSGLYYNDEVDECEVEKETRTSYQQIPVLMQPEPKPENAVVTEPITIITEQPIAENLEAEALSAPSIPAKPPDAVTAALTDAGVKTQAAEVLTSTFPAGRIQAAVTYAQGYRGELVSKPGYIIAALKNDWKLPKWCYQSKVPNNRDTQSAVDGRSQSGPSSDPRTESPISAFEQAKQSNPYDEVWKRILDHMRHPDNLDSWIQPLTVSALADSVYIAGIEGQIVHLIASSDYQAETARKVATEIQKALQTAGLDVENVSVSTHREG